MHSAPEVPDDVAALKGALAAERARGLEVAAELAIARAKASKKARSAELQIAQLQRQIYGQRSERSMRLIDQLALEFEELAASATEDELAAEQAAAKTTRCAPSPVGAPSATPSPTTCRASAWWSIRRRLAPAAAAIAYASSART